MLRSRLDTYLRDSNIVDLLPLSSIEPPRTQVREDLGNIADLADSIKRRGLLEPIIVRPNDSKFEIVAGYRRYTAYKLNGIKEIPAIVKELSDKEAFEICLEENLQRKTFDPIEEASAFRWYVERFGYGSTSDLARKIGKSEEYVSHRIMLLRLPTEVQEQVRRRLLSGSDAWELSRMPTAEMQKIMAEAAIKENLTSKELRRVATLSKRELVDSDNDSIPPCEEGAAVTKMMARGDHDQIMKNAILVLRVALLKIDDLIGKSGKGRTEAAAATDELRDIRYALHQLIDQRLNRDYHRDITNEISTFIEKKITEYYRTKDLVSFVASRDDSFTLFPFFGPRELQNRDGMRKRTQRVFKSVNYCEADFTDVRVNIYGNIAIVPCLCRLTYKGKDKTNNRQARVTFVLEKLGKEWRVVHEHWSEAEDGSPPHLPVTVRI